MEGSCPERDPEKGPRDTPFGTRSAGSEVKSALSLVSVDYLLRTKGRKRGWLKSESPSALVRLITRGHAGLAFRSRRVVVVAGSGSGNGRFDVAAGRTAHFDASCLMSANV
jgi:hypothetical protein